MQSNRAQTAQECYVSPSVPLRADAQLTNPPCLQTPILYLIPANAPYVGFMILKTAEPEVQTPSQAFHCTHLILKIFLVLDEIRLWGKPTESFSVLLRARHMEKYGDPMHINVCPDFCLKEIPAKQSSLCWCKACRVCTAWIILKASTEK